MGVGRVGLASLKSENCWTHPGGLTKAMTVPANKPLAGTQYLLPPTMTLLVNYLTPPTPPCPSTASWGKGPVCLVQLRLLSASMVPGPRSGWISQGWLNAWWPALPEGSGWTGCFLLSVPSWASGGWFSRSPLRKSKVTPLCTHMTQHKVNRISWTTKFSSICPCFSEDSVSSIR